MNSINEWLKVEYLAVLHITHTHTLQIAIQMYVLKILFLFSTVYCLLATKKARTIKKTVTDLHKLFLNA